MNEKGQFLLYDGVLAIIILFIIMIVCFNILEKESTVYELDNTYKTPYEVLNLLDTMPYNDESILYSLTMIDDINTELESNLLNITEHIISDNTRYEYILRDITTDKLLLKTSDNKKIIYTETDRYTSYKNIDIQKTGFQMQAIMFNYSNIRKPVKYT